MTKIKMKGEQSIFIFFLIMLFSSCGSIQDANLYGNWNIYHIYHDNEEILGNNFENNGWDVPIYKTKKFYIMQEKWINIYMDIQGSPITAQFEFLKKDTKDLKIYNSSDPMYDGIYSKEIYTDTINDGGIDIVNFFLKLESKNIVILAAKSESLKTYKLL